MRPTEGVAPRRQLAGDAARLWLAGRMKEAEGLYRQLIALDGSARDVADDHANLGALLLAQACMAEARQCLEQALRLRPDHPEAHANLGIVLHSQGDHLAAIAAFRKAIVLRPEFAQAHANLGSALEHQEDLEGAIVAFRTALSLRPDYPEALFNLGVALGKQGHLEQARTFYERALAAKAVFPDALYNLGAVQMQLGNPEAALAACRKAILLQPDHADAQWNCALALLRIGDYAEGWRKYEWRWRKNTPAAASVRPSLPRWDGQPLSSGELLLVAEQGLGDTLQFMRYCRSMARFAERVTLCVPKKLRDLVADSGVVERVLTPAEVPTIGAGAWLPLLSVPGVLGVSPQEPLVTAPYIQVPPERVAHWRERLARGGRPVVALHWQGSLLAEKGFLHGRSLPLEQLAPLAEVEGVRFVSLQKGPGSEQLAGCSFRDRFVACQQDVDQAWDFVETGAIVAACDLVITSDSALAHLAGGLGLPTWLLLQKVPDWRWGLEGETTHWYPSLRLFRQRRRGDWAEVVERVRHALAEELLRPAAHRHVASGGVLEVPVSSGELIDRITILEIKAERLQGEALEHVRRELELLTEVLASSGLAIGADRRAELREVNEALWEIEDAIRERERMGDFGAGFIELARSVYRQNDRRAAIRRRINESCGSWMQEERPASPRVSLPPRFRSMAR